MSWRKFGVGYWGPVKRAQAGGRGGFRGQSLSLGRGLGLLQMARSSNSVTPGIEHRAVKLLTRTLVVCRPAYAVNTAAK